VITKRDDMIVSKSQQKPKPQIIHQKQQKIVGFIKTTIKKEWRG
jgi:hypothetical protein